MKKVLAVLMACVFSFVLASCGGSSTSGTTGTVEEKVKNGETESFEAKVFVDDENCSFAISGIDEDSFMGYTLKVDLENKTDKNLMFALEDVSVNGFMCDPFWANSVQGGKKAKSDISFLSSDFEELGIETVEEIEFTLRVYDEDDWSAPELVEKTFTYTINK